MRKFNHSMTTIFGFDTIEGAELYTLKNHNKGEYRIEETRESTYKLVKEDNKEKCLKV